MKRFLAKFTVIVFLFLAVSPFTFANFGGNPIAGGGIGPDSGDSPEVIPVPATFVETPIDFSPMVSSGNFGINNSNLNSSSNKVAHWDSNEMDLYDVDMTSFGYKVTYELNNPEKGIEFTSPVHGRITSGFGFRQMYRRAYHFGIDIDLETGDPVRAAWAGTVRISNYNSGYGNFVIICHEGGLETLYGHMSELHVMEGQVVNSGQIIGLGGSTGQSTGSHLHFEMRIFGEQIDPSQIISPETGELLVNHIDVNPSLFYHLMDNNTMKFHVVKEGESLESIAKLHEVEIADLCMMNDLEPTSLLTNGRRIRVGNE